MWEHTPNCLHSFLSVKQPKQLCLQNQLLATSYCAKFINGRENRAFASVTPIGLKAGFAGAEGVCAINHTMSFISISTHCPVTATVVQHRVCKHRSELHWHSPSQPSRRQCAAAQLTFLIAIDFIRTVVLAVVEVVAAKDSADAAATGALELVLLTYWCGREQFWRNTAVTMC